MSVFKRFEFAAINSLRKGLLNIPIRRRQSNYLSFIQVAPRYLIVVIVHFDSRHTWFLSKH